jgi:hypothetical protein
VFSFLLGYFFHLITDNLWDNKVGKPIQKNYSAEFQLDPQFVWEVKRDWYGLDFIYLRNNPESIFHRVFLNCEYNNDYLEFLPIETIKQRIAYICEFYQRQDEKVRALFDCPYIYLSKNETDQFVKESTEILTQVYENIWVNEKELPNIRSVLEWQEMLIS